jgi:hypothetical protein
LIEGYPEFALTDLVKTLDPTRLVDSTTGWYDHGAGDFSVSTSYDNNTETGTHVLLRTTITMPIPSVVRHSTPLTRVLTTLLGLDSRVNSEELETMSPSTSKLGIRLMTVFDSSLLTALNKSVEQPGGH